MGFIKGLRYNRESAEVHLSSLLTVKPELSSALGPFGEEV